LELAKLTEAKNYSVMWIDYTESTLSLMRNAVSAKKQKAAKALWGTWGCPDPKMHEMETWTFDVKSILGWAVRNRKAIKVNDVQECTDLGLPKKAFHTFLSCSNVK
jgi:hypothetical protein